MINIYPTSDGWKLEASLSLTGSDPIELANAVDDMLHDAMENAPVDHGDGIWSIAIGNIHWYYRYDPVLGHVRRRIIKKNTLSLIFMGYRDHTHPCLTLVGETKDNDPFVGLSCQGHMPSDELLAKLINEYPKEWQHAQKRILGQ